MTLRFRGKIVLATLLVAAVTAGVAGLLFHWWTTGMVAARIEETLRSETLLIAELLEHNPALAEGALDAEADRLGALAGVRVTFIARDGRVLGDSAEDAAGLAAMENHADRPEIRAARGSGDPVLVRRYSTTTEYDTLYAVAEVDHPALAYVRLARPLRAIAGEQRAVLWLVVGSVAAALPFGALLAWIVSARTARRVAAVAQVARRYATGDLTPAAAYGQDELGEVARALDGVVQELGRRLTELTQERRHLAALLGSMAEGVVVVDAQGRLVMANDAARSMLKLDPTAVGRRYQELIRQPELFSQIGQALAGAPAAGVEFVLARDPSRTCISRAAPIGDAEGGAIVVLHDISDLRRADRVRRDFVANISHELRTPLTAIRGYVETLLDTPPAPEEARQFLEIVARHAARMERLVRDLLRLARLDAGQETPEPIPCDLQEVAHGVVRDLAEAAAARDVRVELSVAPEAATLITDRGRLHDALRNLVENAINHSPAGGVVEIDATREDGRIAIHVLDRGPGIPEQDLRRVFERFYRVDKSRSRPGGTGIGLAISRHLVELLGGTIAAANRPDGGAAFSIRLPLEPPTRPEPEGRPPQTV